MNKNKNETKNSADDIARSWVKECLEKELNSNINTDPLGSWTGIPTDDPYERPIQDADDL
jgi:hypothetical protein